LQLLDRLALAKSTIGRSFISVFMYVSGGSVSIDGQDIKMLLNHLYITLSELFLKIQFYLMTAYFIISRTVKTMLLRPR